MIQRTSYYASPAKIRRNLNPPKIQLRSKISRASDYDRYSKERPIEHLLSSISNLIYRPFIRRKSDESLSNLRRANASDGNPLDVYRTSKIGNPLFSLESSSRFPQNNSKSMCLCDSPFPFACRAPYQAHILLTHERSQQPNTDPQGPIII